MYLLLFELINLNINKNKANLGTDVKSYVIFFKLLEHNKNWCVVMNKH